MLALQVVQQRILVQLQSRERESASSHVPRRCAPAFMSNRSCPRRPIGGHQHSSAALPRKMCFVHHRESEGAPRRLCPCVFFSSFGPISTWTFRVDPWSVCISASERCLLRRTSTQCIYYRNQERGDLALHRPRPSQLVSCLADGIQLFGQVQDGKESKARVETKTPFSR